MDRDNYYQEVLQSDRVHIVQDIKIVGNISGDIMITNIFQNILSALRDGCSQLKRLEVTSPDLSSLHPVLLMKTVQSIFGFNMMCFAS